MPDTSSSLLERLRTRPDEASWQRFLSLYVPLLHAWLGRHAVQPPDADDLVQEVLLTVVQELSKFRYDARRGSFRGWLRGILANRLRGFWRARQHRPAATGDSDFLRVLEQLESPDSDLARHWDREHDRHVAARLLAMIQPEFEPLTWQAFRRTTLDGLEGAAAAAELGLSVNAVWIARSRVLRRLRGEIQGLCD
jgi:RNA polymerase sigma-70 factor (ECF subfamily)